MPQNHVQSHIDLIAQHEQEFLSQRSLSDRLGDRIAVMAGSLSFVAAHLLLFVVWIALNTVPHMRPFDPPPFSLFATIVGLEAILLASFLLMRQTRVSRRAEERDHLMLQLLLLTEKEVTAVLSLERQIAKRLGLEEAANRSELRELSRETSIEEMAQTIKEALPTSDGSAR
jgi:uncharacterized membrane protein